MSSSSYVQRRVVLIGKTGVGKSTIGNKLLGRNAFEAIGSAESVTSQVQTAPAHIDWVVGPPGKEREYKVEVSVTDTPGVMDTKGRNIDFIDEIVKTIRKIKPHMIGFVSAEARFTPEFAKVVEGLKKVITFTQRNFVLIVNKDRTDATIKRELTGVVNAKAISDRREMHELADAKEYNALFHPLVPLVARLQYDEANEDIFMAKLKSHIMDVTTEFNTTGLRTWTEIIEGRSAEGDQLQTDGDLIRVKRLQLESAKQNLQNDIDWHNDRIASMKKGVWVGLIPIAGWIAAGGMAIAWADSEQKIKALTATQNWVQESINSLSNNVQAIAQAKAEKEREIKELKEFWPPAKKPQPPT